MLLNTNWTELNYDDHDDDDDDDDDNDNGDGQVQILKFLHDCGMLKHMLSTFVTYSDHTLAYFIRLFQRNLQECIIFFLKQTNFFLNHFLILRICTLTSNISLFQSFLQFFLSLFLSTFKHLHNIQCTVYNTKEIPWKKKWNHTKNKMNMELVLISRRKKPICILHYAGDPHGINL